MKVREKSLYERCWIAGSALLLLSGLLTVAAHRPNPEDVSGPQTTQASNKKAPAGEALRLNTLGVAYMNQQKSAEAQKYFEQALAADPEFAAARMNLGISLLAQQKIEQAKAALEEASAKLPDNPYAWYNLGLAYK